MKKKILFTTPNFNTAGSGKVVLDLIKGLKHDFEIEIACFNDKGTLFQEVKEAGVKIHLFDFTEKGKPYHTLPKRLKRISSFFKENKFDLIHSWHYLDDWTEPLAAKLAGIPFVFTKKSMSWDKRHWWLRSKLATHIITINNDMNTDFYPGWEKAVYMPLGLDLQEYAPLASSRQALTDLPISNEDFVIMSVANLVPVKGIETVIEALHQLKNPALKYVLVGGSDDKYRQKLDALIAQHELSEQVFFVGKQSNVKPFLAAADLFVIPTLNEGRKEGQPMAPIEAMACQRIVAGSRIPGVKDILAEFPNFIFEAKDVVALVKIITQTAKLATEERNSIAQEMRKKVEDNYAMKDFIAGHKMLFESLIKA